MMVTKQKGNNKDTQPPITPSTWGEPLWRVMHIFALAYPDSPSDEIKSAYRNFYTSIQLIIPCEVCREGYVTIINQLPLEPALETKDALFQWTVDVHNRVALKTGKPRMDPHFVRKEYIYGGGGGGGSGGGGGANPDDHQQASANNTKRLVLIFVFSMIAVAGLTYTLFGRH
jgi:hypothetical protein